MSPIPVAGPVIGRFAPSPTGDLHFGSLISAVGSFLEAKTANGVWLLRIEDIDPPREVAGSASRMIKDLQNLGMQPDRPVLYQSTRLGAYELYVNQLLEAGLAYPCACTRKDLPPSGIYPGICRDGISSGKEPRAIRFRLADKICQFTDKLQGRITESPARNIGDFIIQRADGLYAYQLAVVVDDDFQGITQVVRGADLLDSTGRQLCLQEALGLKSPDYMHLPLALSADGKKLSKRVQADPVKQQDPAFAVATALVFLGQQPPTGLALRPLWDWALEHWNSDLIPRQKPTGSTDC
jgi:glutamyl-Q tRNA(Asp) synthetase